MAAGKKGAQATAARNDDIGVEKRLELCRHCEKRAHDLFLQNLVKGTGHLSLGQEAVAAGFGVAMRKGDKSFCTYRGLLRDLAIQDDLTDETWLKA